MKFWFLAFLLISFVSSCSEEQKLTPISESENICRYSNWLKIAEFDNFTQIDIINPTTKQIINSYKVGKDGITQGVSLAVFSSTHIGMLAELNSLDKIVAVADIKYVYNELVRNAYNTGRIYSFENESSPNAEKLIKTGAKVIVHSAFSGPFPNEKKLNEIGITCIPNFDWSETHPLGKAEWILLFGYLTGKQEFAKEKFRSIEAAYKDEVRRAKKIDRLVISGNIYGDFWDTPSGESYHAKLIADAGGNYLYSETKGTGSLSLTYEKVIKDGSEADIWINPGFPSKKKIIQANSKASFFKAYNSGLIFCYSHDINKYWEMNAVQPHLVLRDYRRIFEQSDLENLYFYKEVN